MKLAPNTAKGLRTLYGQLEKHLRSLELVNSRDGEVRSLKIVLPNNKVSGRPLNLLFPIECPTTEAKESIQCYDDVNDRKQGDNQLVRVRQRRYAAMKAEQRIKEQLKDK